MSDMYTLEITYRFGDKPIVEVLSPKLVKRDGSAKIPHVYPGDRPCLYHPKLQEWTSADLIAETIVPWASEWLFYYEYWLAIGEWLGGGEEVSAKGQGDSAVA